MTLRASLNPEKLSSSAPRDLRSKGNPNLDPRLVGRRWHLTVECASLTLYSSTYKSSTRMRRPTCSRPIIHLRTKRGSRSRTFLPQGGTTSTNIQILATMKPLSCTSRLIKWPQQTLMTSTVFSNLDWGTVLIIPTINLTQRSRTLAKRGLWSCLMRKSSPWGREFCNISSLMPVWTFDGPNLI